MAEVRKPLRVEVSVVVEAPLKAVWTYLMDITKIPEFHPRVDRVDVLSGSGERAEGVSYRCSITHSRSKGTCVEEVSSLMPMKSLTTTIPNDS